LLHHVVTCMKQLYCEYKSGTCHS